MVWCKYTSDITAVWRWDTSGSFQRYAPNLYVNIVILAPTSMFCMCHKKHWIFTHWSVMLKPSDFRVRVCEVKTNSLLFSVSFNGYHSVNMRLTTETMTGYLLQNRAEKLDADVWYSLSRSCYFFLFLLSISPAPFPPFHATFGSSREQSTSTVMKLLPHFPTPFCHTPARWNMHQTPL